MDNADFFIKLLKSETVSALKIDIELLADLDFSDANLIFPLGMTSSGECVPYSGVLQGHGHSIKSLQMNNKNEKDAGLFCGMENATIENLVIDSSCSFTGYHAGSLAISVTGSLSVINVTNSAAVSGRREAGGFIGIIKGTKQGTVISFDDCMNEGNVTGKEYYFGGFIGCIDDNTNITMSVSNSINNGIVNGYSGVGGFVGFVSKNIILTFSNSTNNGSIRGDSNYVGGFAGMISHTIETSMTISSSTNNGSINGTYDYIGGFVGGIDFNQNTDVTVSKSINNGMINGNQEIGGLFGCITQNENIIMAISNYTNNALIIKGNRYVGGLSGLHRQTKI